MWFRRISLILLLATSVAEDALPWWRTATFYEVYPRSFKDSDGDGSGDIKGIVQRADYFREIGVDAIWLSPIHILPSADFGFPVSNETEPDSILSTMDDLDELIAKLRQLGIKLLIDFIPNHTSDKHLWFHISADPTHILHQYYRDFYVWHDGNGTTANGTQIPPNNWLSVVGGSAWEWSEQRKQFYLHQFMPEQPDLNFRNVNVLGNVTEILSFWLAKGVDGFRLGLTPHLVEDANFTNEHPLPGTAGDTWFSLNHTYTKHQPETFQLASHWADVIYNFTQKDGSEKVLLVEVYDEPPLANNYYGSGLTLQIPSNFMLMTKGSPLTQPSDFKNIIGQWMDAKPNNSVASWIVGDHFLTRTSDLYGREMVDTICLLTGVLPGIKVVYFGEEIGMEASPVTWDQAVDPWARRRGPYHYHEWTRDIIRTPMQWDDSLNAGFSTNETTWLPVNPNYWRLNVEAQKSAPVSHLKVFQAMAKARKDPVLQRGDLKILTPNNHTLIVLRSYQESHFTLIVNLGTNSSTYNTQNLFGALGLDTDMSVVIGSINSGYTSGDHFKKGSLSFTLRPKAAILLRSGAPQDLYSFVFLLFFVIIAIFVP